MKERLKEIIAVKCGGSQTQFAKELNIHPQRVTKLLTGESFGLAAVKQILTAYKDIDARWLIFGEGQMYTPSGRAEALQRAVRIFDLDKYARWMTRDELTYYDHCIATLTVPDFPKERMAELEAKYESMMAVHNEALSRSRGRK